MFGKLVPSPVTHPEKMVEPDHGYPLPLNGCAQPRKSGRFVFLSTSDQNPTSAGLGVGVTALGYPGVTWPCQENVAFFKGICLDKAFFYAKMSEISKNRKSANFPPAKVSTSAGKKAEKCENTVATMGTVFSQFSAFLLHLSIF